MAAIPTNFSYVLYNGPTVTIAGSGATPPTWLTFANVGGIYSINNTRLGFISAKTTNTSPAISNLAPVKTLTQGQPYLLFAKQSFTTADLDLTNTSIPRSLFVGTLGAAQNVVKGQFYYTGSAEYLRTGENASVETIGGTGWQTVSGLASNLVEALENATSPSATNPYATQEDLGLLAGLGTPIRAYNEVGERILLSSIPEAESYIQATGLNIEQYFLNTEVLGASSNTTASIQCSRFEGNGYPLGLNNASTLSLRATTASNLVVLGGIGAYLQPVGTFFNCVFSTSVRVPSNEVVVLRETEVVGSIVVDTDAKLYLRPGTQVPDGYLNSLIPTVEAGVYETPEGGRVYDQRGAVPSQTTDTIEYLLYAPAIELNFLMSTMQTTDVSGNVTFTLPTKIPGRGLVLRLVNGSTAATLNFPSTWTWKNSIVPTSIAANQRATLSLYCWGNDDKDVEATYSI